MMKAVGVPVTGSFTDSLSSAVQTRKDLELTVGGYKVFVEPGQTSADTITIKFKKQ